MSSVNTILLETIPKGFTIGGGCATLWYLMMTSIAIDRVQSRQLTYRQVLCRFWLPTFVSGVFTILIASTSSITCINTVAQTVRFLMVINLVQLVIIQVETMKVK